MTGASMPWRSNAIGEQRNRRERLGGLVHRRLAPGRPARPRRPSRPRAGCGCPRRSRSPRGRPCPARPAKVSLRPPLATRQLVDLGEDASGGGAGEVGAARRGRGAWPARRRSSRRRRARRRSRRRWPRPSGRRPRAGRAAGGEGRRRCVATTTEAPSSIASRACAGPASVATARARTRSETKAAGRGAERRHEALRGHEHGRAVAHARADLADGGGQARARHGEHHEVHAGELDLGDGLHVDGAVELEARAGSARSRASARSASA